MKVTKEQVVLEIDKFLAVEGGAYDWVNFCSIRIDDPELNNVRILCADLPIAYPPVSGGQYCADEGLDELLKIANELRGN